MQLICGQYTLFGTVDECIEFIKKQSPTTISITSGDTSDVTSTNNKLPKDINITLGDPLRDPLVR